MPRSRMEELYLHSSTHLHGVVLNYNFTIIAIVKSFILFLPEQRVVKKGKFKNKKTLRLGETTPGRY
jgi:hypothetical protein